MSDENSVRTGGRTDGAEPTPRVADLTTNPAADGLPSSVSRRNLLRSAGAVAGGSLLTTVSGRGRAATRDDERPLDVTTTDVEVLGRETAETSGEVDGMDRVDCRRCRIGAQVSPVGSGEWYGGFHDVVTARVSIRVAVTLAGLRPGRYECRLVACPITHDAMCFGNSITVVVGPGRGERKKRERREKQSGCSCGHDHAERHHLTVCGDDWRVAREYAFMVSGDAVRKSSRSCAPGVVGHHRVTTDRGDHVGGDIVTGAVAGGADSFLFDGEVTDLRRDEGVTVYLDGAELEGV